MAAASKSKEGGRELAVNSAEIGQGKDATGFDHFKPILTSSRSLKRKSNIVETETEEPNQDVSTTGKGHTEITEVAPAKPKPKKQKPTQPLESISDQAVSNGEANHKVTKKQKKKKRRGNNDEHSQQQMDEIGGDPPSQNIVQVEERISDSDHLAQQTTDDDWLRTKTSRILGLVEEDGVLGSELATNSKNATAEPSSKDAVDFNLANLVSLSHSPFNDAYKFVSSNGRLFLRNLPFGSTETDIEDVFSAFGTIEEVCSIPGVSSICFMMISG